MTHDDLDSYRPGERREGITDDQRNRLRAALGAGAIGFDKMVGKADRAPIPESIPQNVNVQDAREAMEDPSTRVVQWNFSCTVEL